MKNKLIFSLLIVIVMIALVSDIAARAVSSAHRAINGVFMLPVFPLRFRLCDSYGCGHYGASRDGGKRKHKGIDIITSAGQVVYSPISGRVIGTGSAYASGRHPNLRMIKIQDGVTTVSIMYISPDVSVGDTVDAGQEIGTAQSLQSIYPGIPDHIHVEVKIFGAHVDPKPYFLKQA